MDNLELPRVLYRVGGEWQLESGRYAIRTVNTTDELEAALADGWHLDQYAAKAAQQPAAQADEPTTLPPVDETSPPTKAELQQRLAELGIDFDARWGVAKLQAALDGKA